MPLFLVTLPKCPENQGIFNMKTIGFFRVVVEPLNKSTKPPQCYRCQEFFHHSRFCARAPKCLKCSGGHLTSECTKSAKAPAKCANCRGPHPANFSGCPKNPINTKPNKNKPTKNVWQERAAASKENNIQPKPSFLEVVKGKQNKSLDAKSVMSQMAQMMSHQYKTTIRHIPGKDNIVADALSRIDEICLPPTIEYAAIAKAQDSVQELTTLTFLNNYNLKFDKLPVIESEYTIICDVSTGHPKLTFLLLLQRNL
ncbi:nucleic-acid-binding protein from transposon X-element [Trichonephila inaurata madagascariensis]|uniref:Nucleic-acid-binding protein from transposon X-element n=1 Tax=Trichonephila inaurata madagascariensis TaxID=2747483 RepID=A0A8X6JUD2_9ARAC|nr:nucleic-acid-binding protein from transposon X-element [Trichonephila inaurata madagascariensis]